MDGLLKTPWKLRSTNKESVQETQISFGFHKEAATITASLGVEKSIKIINWKYCDT